MVQARKQASIYSNSNMKITDKRATVRAAAMQLSKNEVTIMKKIDFVKALRDYCTDMDMFKSAVTYATKYNAFTFCDGEHDVDTEVAILLDWLRSNDKFGNVCTKYRTYRRSVCIHGLDLQDIAKLMLEHIGCISYVSSIYDDLSLIEIRQLMRDGRI